MAAEIELDPTSERGRAILDELEKRTEMQPSEVLDDGRRRYYLSAQDADVYAFDPMLDKIDKDWRDHVKNLAPPDTLPGAD